MDFAWLWALIGAGVGAYFGGYLKTKGKNLATHEDIKKLTKITEEIKAEISDVVWNRQRRWELKREVLFGAIKRLAEVDDALTGVYAMVDMQEMKELEKDKIRDKWNEAERGLDETVLLVEIVCEKETVQAFRKFEDMTLKIVTRTANLKDASAYPTYLEALRSSLNEAMAAARKELRIDA